MAAPGTTAPKTADNLPAFPPVPVAPDGTIKREDMDNFFNTLDAWSQSLIASITQPPVQYVGWSGHTGPNILSPQWVVLTSYEHLHFWRDIGGVVHLRGFAHCNNTAANFTDVIFQFPTGFRPVLENVHFQAFSQTVTGGGTIDTAGNVFLAGGSSLTADVYFTADFLTI